MAVSSKKRFIQKIRRCDLCGERAGHRLELVGTTGIIVGSAQIERDEFYLCSDCRFDFEIGDHKSLLDRAVESTHSFGFREELEPEEGELADEIVREILRVLVRVADKARWTIDELN